MQISFVLRLYRQWSVVRYVSGVAKLHILMFQGVITLLEARQLLACFGQQQLQLDLPLRALGLRLHARGRMRCSHVVQRRRWLGDGRCWWGWRRHARLGIWDASISRTSIEQAHLSCRRRVPELGVQCAGFLPLVRSLVLRWVDFARAREAWGSGVLVARAAPRIQSRQLRAELLKTRCCHRLSIHRVARWTGRALGQLKHEKLFDGVQLPIFCILTIIACIFFLSKAMNVIPVGFTYATYGGMTITAVTIFGIFKYNQIPNIYGIIGISFIIIGVVLLNTLGKTN